MLQLSMVQQKCNVNHMCDFIFSYKHVTKKQKEACKINLNKIFYLTHYIQVISLTCIPYKNYYWDFFHIDSSKSGVNFNLHHISI